jgi:tyrosyl-tRNA synthetase
LLDRDCVLGARFPKEAAMTQYQSTLLRLLDERGYIHQLTDASGLDQLAAQQVVPGYIGFDATAPSLHVGSLVQIMMLRRLQQTGHKPVVVMGGGTTRIGDPTGRDESRKMLTDETIEANIASIRTIFSRLLTFGDGPTDAIMVNNQDWLGKLGYIELLQEVGTHFTINRMLTFDSVRLRLDREQPMTFLEFNYMILQGYDFRHLSRHMDVRLQMGGSDQWGNIVNGMELGRRMDGADLYGLTTPLLTTADGAKMGKTAAGAVWLNEDALPAWDFWQYWRNCDDRDVGKFLRLFTDLPLDEILRLEALGGSEINAAKVILANEVTSLCRGEEAARTAEATAAATFAAGGIGADLPEFVLPAEGATIVDALVGIGFAASRGEAKRLVAGGGARIDGQSVTDENFGQEEARRAAPGLICAPAKSCRHAFAGLPVLCLLRSKRLPGQQGF